MSSASTPTSSAAALNATAAAVPSSAASSAPAPSSTAAAVSSPPSSAARLIAPLDDSEESSSARRSSPYVPTELSLASSASAAVVTATNASPLIISRSPVTRLYRHALESVFAFCSLADLGSLMSVSRDCQCAVMSMASIRCDVAHHSRSRDDDVSWLLCCAASRLSRHVIGVTRGSDFTSASLDASRLRLLTARMPQLESLDCLIVEPLTDSTASEIGRWTRMRRLRLLIDEGDVSNTRGGGVNSLLAAIAAHMPLLHSLTLQLPHMQQDDDPPVSFRPLAAVGSSASALRSFHLQSSGSPHNFTLTQLSDLRALRWLHDLDVGYLTMDKWKQLLLLRPPQSQLDATTQADSSSSSQLQSTSSSSSSHMYSSSLPPSRQQNATTRLALQWRILHGVVEMGDDLASLMCQLPRLTHLSAHLTSARTPFLHSLTQMREMRLVNCQRVNERRVERATLIELQQCTQITSLTLADFHALDSELMGEVLPCMPQLSRLHLLYSPNVSSLRFLSPPALTSSLTDLRVCSCDSCPWSEVVHVHALRELRRLHLRLHDEWSDPMPQRFRAAFTPPPLAARLFPHLTHLDIGAETEEQEDGEEKEEQQVEEKGEEED